MKSLITIIIICISIQLINAQQVDTIENQELTTVTILSNWANENTPITLSKITKDQLEKNNIGQDIPYLLQNIPGIVETSDAGAGIGYTGIRVRGSDATRTNVTINGVPLNDAESQSVYWVNMPDFASSTDEIQVQRGVGTSTSGAGAFGATVNLNTNKIKAKSLALNNSFGSYNSMKNTLLYSTGLLGSIGFDARLSSITSDGYIDRASSNLKSYYLSAVILQNNSSLRFNTWGGKEITYQSWNGLPQQLLDSNRTYNTAGTSKPGSPYLDEVDNYSQYHNQLIFNKNLSNSIHFNFTAHYTKGFGFFENYKSNQVLNTYNPILVDTSDIVIRRCLDNDFYGGIFSINYENKGHQITMGGGYNQYLGNHFGRLHWVAKSSIPISNNTYYQNEATKNDFNVFIKDQYNIDNQWNIYADLQLRTISYQYIGAYFDEATSELIDIKKYNAISFFNPKVGLQYKHSVKNIFYASLAVANREPNRNDYIGDFSSKGSANIPSEKLLDYEVGYKHVATKWKLNSNIYFMDYKDQLVLNGKLNFVGEPLRVNVPNSYRFGVEIDGTYQLNRHFHYNGNIALSKNKIERFTAYRDDWSTGKQFSITHLNTDIAYSPNITSVQGIEWNPTTSFNIGYNHKFVGSQYLDNSSSTYAKLSAYNYGNLLLSYQTSYKSMNQIILKLQANNLWNSKYVNNAWIYRFSSPGYNPVPDDLSAAKEEGDDYNLKGVFPQATRNFMFALSLKF
jgi:iron complex outermembrane recepter protein